MSAVRIGIVGVAGRMGQAITREIAASQGAAVLAGGIEQPGNPALGQDPGQLAGVGATGVKITADAAALFGNVDVVIDFSPPAAVGKHAALAA